MSQAEGIQVVLSGVNKRVQAVLHKAGLDTMLGTENICSHIDGALSRARHLLNTDYNFTA
jgi:SulP family sulfate permease